LNHYQKSIGNDWSVLIFQPDILPSYQYVIPAKAGIHCLSLSLHIVGAGFSREGACKGESFPAKASPTFDIASFVPLSVNAKLYILEDVAPLLEQALAANQIS